MHAVVGRHFILYTEEVMHKQRVFRPLIQRQPQPMAAVGAEPKLGAGQG